jgi:hypothetical protein
MAEEYVLFLTDKHLFIVVLDAVETFKGLHSFIFLIKITYKS